MYMALFLMYFCAVKGLHTNRQKKTANDITLCKDEAR